MATDPSFHPASAAFAPSIVSVDRPRTRSRISSPFATATSTSRVARARRWSCSLVRAARSC